MGYGKWSDDAYSHLKSTYSTKSRASVFTNTNLVATMDPKGVKFRESRDSVEHPESVPVAVFLDVTGSMGGIPEVLIKEKLGALMNTLIAHGIRDPQVLFGAIGDHISDSAPLQVGQFETETSLLDQWLTGMYLEAGGGGQSMESYLLAWLFASRHTSLDCFEKRGKKGFLFTIGDEWTWDTLTADYLKSLMGYAQSETLTAEKLLKEAQRMYHVFHIHVNETGYRNDNSVIGPWKKLLGERLIILEDHTTVAETIATTVAVINGADMDKVISSFDPSTALTVKTALARVTKGAGMVHQPKKGIIKL